MIGNCIAAWNFIDFKAYLKNIAAQAPLEGPGHFGGMFYEAEAAWLLAHKWAQGADDILDRRTKHGLHLSQEHRVSLLSYLND